MTPISYSKRSEIVKSIATKLGFDFCGIAKAEYLEEEAPRLENWLNQGMHGEMHYMANHFDKRLDPSKLVDGAKTVISLLYNYYPQEPLKTAKNYKIAKYAYGEDYHFVIKRKLKDFLERLKAEIGDINGRVFVDSAPVHERAWAQKAGLGWVGKNSLLLNRSRGSFFFLAELIIDVEMAYDSPAPDFCGTCTKCMDACPTDAIPTPYVVDGSKCISYFTIELKEELPDSVQGKFEDWVFGCDICQDVCPWNRFATPTREEGFQPNDALKGMQKRDWEELTKETFDNIFRKSAVKRTKYAGLKRNIAFVADKQ